jgi:hypothetical protein
MSPSARVLLSAAAPAGAAAPTTVPAGVTAQLTETNISSASRTSPTNPPIGR